MSDEDVIRELVQTAEAIGVLGVDEDRFRAAFDAFIAGDRESYQRLLTEFKLLERCELVCDWICSKYCVLVCLQLCGPPTDVEVPDLAEFAAVVTRITQDEEVVERLANAVADRDAEGFRALVTELKIERFCHLLCHWACSVRCRLLCEVVCSPTPTHVASFVNELTRAGMAITALAADPRAVADVAKAALTGNCDLVRGVIGRLGLFEDCHLVCEWLCTWRCVRVCLLLCRAFPIEQPVPSLSEAFEFARATGRLAKEPQIIQRLSDAIEAGDADTFEQVVRAFDLGRFCIQLCHWICVRHCGLFCRCVCTLVLRPWFTHVGHFDINADIDPGTGLTNKGLVFAELDFQGGPGFAFHDCLELRGFCPVTSPIDGTAMRYRFVLGDGTPITGSRVCPADAGTRIISWPQNVGGVAGAALVPTFQTISIEGAPAPDPTPPAPGSPWYGPAKHVIVPDSATGWVLVDPAAIAGGFTTLIGFNTSVVVLGEDPAPGVLAGVAVPAANQRVGTDLKITFEATRVAGPPSPPDFTNALTKIHINNWGQVGLLDLLQFHTSGGTPCSPLSTDLDIEYTVDHEHIAAWSITVTSAALAVPVAGPSGTTPRGGAGTDHHNIASWPSCSYTVSLSTRRAVTTGLRDDDGTTIPKTFCK